MRQRFRAIPRAVSAAPIRIGIQLTRTSSAAATPAQPAPTMNINRDIQGPNEIEAMPGTTSGFSGDYLWGMGGIISGDVLEWRGEDAGLYPDAITVTIVAVAGNTAVINLQVDSGESQALIYCSVNGVEFVSNAAISAAPGS